jgi:fused signal recognition particle receptor
MFEKLKTSLNLFAERLSKTELRGKELDRIIEDLKLTLIENDVAYTVAEEICDRLRESVIGISVPRLGDTKKPVKAILYEVLTGILDGSGDAAFFKTVDAKRQLHEPCVIVFVGINGTGKTTSIAKLADLLIKRGYSVVLACADTYRAGSIEQLEEHARRIGVRTVRQSYGSDAAAVAFDAINYARSHGINAVLVDTAGRMQTNRNLLEEMRKIVRVTDPDMVILVVDSLAGNDAVEQARAFSEAVRIDGVFLTKLDADARGGSAISIARVIRKPILFAGIGQSYSDVISFDPDRIVSRILS